MKQPLAPVLRILLCLLPGCVLWSCKTDVQRAGADLLLDDERIIVRADTFRLSSSLVAGCPLAVTSDSFLLGEMDNKYGHLHADFMTQLACPTGFVYPADAVLDSVCLYLYYRQAFGDNNAPLAINVYQMDKKTFSYSEPLYTDIDISEYCSLHDSTRITNHPYVVTAGRYTDSAYSTTAGQYIPCIPIRMPDHIAQRIFNIRDFSSQEAFNDIFKGLYVTTDFGGATLLSLIDVNMGVYYHFSYVRAGSDTIVEKDTKGFYSNHEVRQVNRFDWLDSDIQVLQLNSDTSYIVSPVHLYTRLSFPMRAIQDSMFTHMGDKRPYVNEARLMLPVLNVYDGKATNKGANDWAQPAQTMLLIREADFRKIVNTEDIILSDSVAMYSKLITTKNSLDVTHVYYSFDMATILTKQLRESQYENLDMLLMPINIVTSTTTSGVLSITEVNHNLSLTATEIYSAQNPHHGLELEVVYSGF